LPQMIRPYAWYLRVPDLPGFLRHIGPALEQRLATSPLSGHTGELKLSFYRDGLRMQFEAGKLVEVGPWQPTHTEGGDAGFPGLTLLHLVFGYRTMQELDEMLPDCWTANDGVRELLHVLFPKRPSDVWPVS
ncbi:MAG: GNAT family N-acetyltransferase, partial [Anaerolineae bacterium]